MDRNIGVVEPQGRGAVALRKESVDRNIRGSTKKSLWANVALRKESVDRNLGNAVNNPERPLSLSARRAWIEMPTLC